MTWAETIDYIRHKPEYADLVRLAYFEKELPLNVERFMASEEFEETIKVLSKYAPGSRRILDVGCGAGFTSIAFAIKGFAVTSLEPDPDETIGYGAINKLAIHYNVKIEIEPSFFEENKLAPGIFDVVYARQSMHHANDLQAFIGAAYRLLKPGGILFTVRDHVVDNQKEKTAFLESHPLQKFYGGENAYSELEYKSAMVSSGFQIKKRWKYYESVLNYFPTKKSQVRKLRIRDCLFFFKPKALNEDFFPGRMYSFLAKK